jgi:hypothetical protein
MAMEPKQYLAYDKYRLAADSLYAVSGMILFSFAKHNCDTKNLIIRNFIARSAMMLKAIFRLWEISDYQDAWVIYRTLLDRLFHLHYLGEKDEFQEYESWSFYEQCKAQNKVKSDDKFKHEAVGWVYDLTKEQKIRLKDLSKNPPKWRRPKAESVAKSMGLDCFYKYGYDFASSHVHPMANDGQQDFFTITKLEPAPRFPEQISVLSNSIIASSVLLQEALNHSSFKWRRVLWDYLEQIRYHLEKGNDSYKETFLKLANMFPKTGLCEKITSPHSQDLKAPGGEFKVSP